MGIFDVFRKGNKQAYKKKYNERDDAVIGKKVERAVSLLGVDLIRFYRRRLSELARPDFSFPLD